jgi:hypothetical protein
VSWSMIAEPTVVLSMSWVFVIDEALKESKGSSGPVLVQPLMVICAILVPVIAAVDVWRGEWTGPIHRLRQATESLGGTIENEMLANGGRLVCGTFLKYGRRTNRCFLQWVFLTALPTVRAASM